MSRAQGINSVSSDLNSFKEIASPSLKSKVSRSEKKQVKKQKIADYGTCFSVPKASPSLYGPPTLELPQEGMVGILEVEKGLSSSKATLKETSNKEAPFFSSDPDENHLIPLPSQAPKLNLKITSRPPQQKQHSFLYPKNSPKNTMGAICSEIVEDNYKTQASLQKECKKTLEELTQLRKRLSEDFYKKLQEGLKKAAEKESWEFLGNVANGLLYSAGFITGAFVTTLGVSSGNIMATCYGVEMMFGSLASFASFCCQQIGVDSQVTAAFAVAGSLLTFHGTMMSFPLFAPYLPQKLSEIAAAAWTVLKCFPTYKTNKAEIDRISAEKDRTLLDRERVLNLDHIKEISSFVKLEDMHRLTEMASLCLEDIKKIVSNILQLKRR